MRQPKHRNRFIACGILTLLSQHMQYLTTLPSSSTLIFLPLIICEGRGSRPSSSTGTRSSSKGTSVSLYLRFPLLFLRPKNFGSGLLLDRVCSFLGTGGGRAGDGEVRSCCGGDGSRNSVGGLGNGLLLPFEAPRVGVVLLELLLDKSRELHDEGIRSAVNASSRLRAVHFV